MTHPFSLNGTVWTVNSHVHVLLFSVKFNGEIDILQFIFTRCVVYSFIQLQKISMTASMKKITWCVIYLIKVNYTSNKSTWTSPKNLNIRKHV